MAQLAFARDARLPLYIWLAQSRIAALEAFKREAPAAAAARHVDAEIFGNANWLKASEGQLAALHDPALFRRRELGEAAFRAELSRDPYNEQALLGLAEFYLAKEETLEAVESIAKIWVSFPPFLRQQPDFPSVKIEPGTADRLIINLETAPTTPVREFVLAGLYRTAGNDEKAREEWANRGPRACAGWQAQGKKVLAAAIAAQAIEAQPSFGQIKPSRRHGSRVRQPLRRRPGAYRVTSTRGRAHRAKKGKHARADRRATVGLDRAAERPPCGSCRVR